MTTFEVKIDLPDRLAREALAAGLLTPQALRDMVRDAIKRRAVQQLLDGAARATVSGGEPLSMQELQAEVASVRRERKAR